MLNSDTLTIRHLSNSLTEVQKEDFLKHFGAEKVKCIYSAYKKYNVVFAKFSSSSAARAALHRLHQVEVLGTPLTVEYARQKEDFNDSQEKCSADKEKRIIKKKHKDFVQKLNAWHHSLQPTRPPPYHQRYEYPPVTISVLTNICRVIATVPKLYTQVLHLMNRMNLPCPFGALLSGPEIYVETKQTQSTAEKVPLVITKPQQEEEDETEESEIENEVCEQLVLDVLPALPFKRRLKQSGQRLKKRRVFVAAPAVAPSTREPMLPEQMFEREAPVASLHMKKIELNIALQRESLREEEGRGRMGEESLPGFGLLPPTKISPPALEMEGQDETLNPVKGAITLMELRSNRIPTKDQKVLPVFRNYQTGAPSCRLYVKNIAKQVELKDLHYVYSYFLDVKNEEQAKMFDVRLMQEGRMKGQAFITLPCVAQAKTALSETNGYILKGKPLVVQFARSSAKPK